MIRHLSLYETVDKAEARFLWEAARRQRYLVDPGTYSVVRYFPGFEKRFWLSNNRRLTPLSPQSYQVEAYNLFHALMHSQLGARYGHKMRGKPRLCMLFEALASSLDLYFALKVFRHSGLEATTKATLFPYAHNSRATRLPFLQAFNSMSTDPFGSYRCMVEFLSSYLTRLSDLDRYKKPDERWSQGSRLIGSLRQSPYFVFAYHYDFANFLLYRDFVCGSKSTSADVVGARECLRLLKESGSLIDFLGALGVPS